MDRRQFFKTSVLATGALATEGLSITADAAPAPKNDNKPNVWKGWKDGEFQAHFIYTGQVESIFLIFPDGTSMLLDCGDIDPEAIGKPPVPVRPHKGRRAPEWISRYVQRVNPNGSKVDYIMLSHYHNDHCGDIGNPVEVEKFNGKDYPLSGFTLAAKYLDFARGIDRSWPDYVDPVPVPVNATTDLVKLFYDRMSAERGMKMEKFEVGAVDQIRMLHNPDKYKSFSIRNICGNGRICGKDGKIIDLYADRKAAGDDKLNENGMSLGMIVSYGPFKFYTAGDFSDKWKVGGVEFMTEDALADVVEHVNVAKMNHHGHYSMPAKLVKALSAQVYTSCVWCQRHNVDPVMQTIADTSLYPGERLSCPGVFPPERYDADEGKDWMKILPPEAFDPSHVVITVPPSGKTFTVTHISACDESMTVRKERTFKTL